MATLSRIALITGANRLDSIGYAAARQLALKHNFTIILGSRTLSASVYDAVKQLEGDGAKQGVYPLQINIVDDSSIKQAAKEVEEKFGRLDVLVNSAAVGLPDNRTEVKKQFPAISIKSFEYTRLDFRETFESNVYGIVETINTFLPLLTKSANPRIVNVTSGAGSIQYASTSKEAPFMAYGVSKAALNMVTVMYSKELPELNPAFKINAGCPGYTKNSFNNYTGYRTPDEGAAVVTWLATLPDDGPTGGFFSDHRPVSFENGKFMPMAW